MSRVSFTIPALITTACCGVGSAADLIDPSGLVTHEVMSCVSWEGHTDIEQFNFQPASTSDECAHTSLWFSQTDLHVSTYCQDVGSEVDVITFDWKNLSGRNFYTSAEGIASTTISSFADGEFSLSSIDNENALSYFCNWTISVFDDQQTLLGNLDQIGSTVSMEADKQYEIIFEIGGYDTLTSGWSKVFWNVELAYFNENGGTSAVPGFGGLALFGGTIALRRRRRR